MGVNNYDITEKGFDRTQSLQYELSILLGMDSFTYVIRDPRTAQLLVLRSYAFSASHLSDWVPLMQRAIQQDDILRPNLIKRIYVSFLSDRVTLVPRRLFIEGKESEYLSQLTDISLDDKCRSETIAALDLAVIYAIGEERLEATRRRFNPIKTRHFSAGLLRHWSEQNQMIAGHRAIYCCVRDGHVILAGIQDNRIHYFNVFTGEQLKNNLYFIHLVYQQCGWSTDRTPLYLCGDIPLDSGLLQELRNYVEDIRFLNFQGTIHLGEQFQSLPSHLYYDLLCQLP